MIKSSNPDWSYGHQVKLLPSVTDLAYDLLRFKGYLGNVGYYKQMFASGRMKARVRISLFNDQADIWDKLDYQKCSER